jgi:hypothetical protein
MRSPASRCSSGASEYRCSSSCRFETDRLPIVHRLQYDPKRHLFSRPDVDEANLLGKATGGQCEPVVICIPVTAELMVPPRVSLTELPHYG